MGATDLQIERISGEEYDRIGVQGAVECLRALVPGGESVAGSVAEILSSVRTSGDEAVLEYTRKFDTRGGETKPLRVGQEELDLAIKQLPLDVVAGLQVTIANVAQVAQADIQEDRVIDLPQGQRVRLRELPVGAAAVYVPGGRAPYPSTVVMGVVTARAAGVLDVAVCSPPQPDGEIHPAILGVCRLCGVERVYRMGGAQAIAALAHGTEAVRPVDVIVGPGNLYVQEAKRQLSGIVGIDGFAGPSDLLVALGDDVQERDLRLVALDMLAQAEHGRGSLVAAIVCTAASAEALSAQLNLLLKAHPTVTGAAFAIVEVAGAREAVKLANAFAPEHLQLVGREVEGLAQTVRSAGCVFVGVESATAFGDYVVGSNHILPTGGAARFASSLSPRQFRRCMFEVHVSQEGAVKLARAGVPIATVEGFDVHAESMSARIEENLPT